MSLRNPKPWEICDSPNSLTGVHNWVIEKIIVYNEATGIAKNHGKKTPRIICSACKKEPVANHRGRLLQEHLEAEKTAREKRQMINSFQHGNRRLKRR